MVSLHFGCALSVRGSAYVVGTLGHTDHVTSLLDHILTLPPIWVLVVAGALVFLEDALFFGFVLPAEAATVLAGVTTAIGSTDYVLTVVVVVLAAIVGDSVGFEIGRHFFGPKVMHSRWLERYRPRVEAGEDVLRRRGGVAVFLGRFTFFLRAMMPALAGASGMGYRTFLAWNAVGGIVWGTLWVTVGHAAGASYETVESTVGRGVAIALVVIVVLALLVWQVRRHRAKPSVDAG